MTIGDSFPSTLLQARAGDARAITAIYKDMAPIVIGYLRANRVASPEDVAADVFVSMVQSMPTFDGTEDQFRSWLLTIAHRRMVDTFRRDARRREDAMDPAELPDPEQLGPGTDVRVAARLDGQAALAAIDQLTPDQRQVLLLRVLADLSISEISRTVGKPETAVKALLHRATATLKRRLADQRGEAQ